MLERLEYQVETGEPKQWTVDECLMYFLRVTESWITKAS